LFPDVWRLTPNWRPVEQNAILWTWSTSLEHLVPFPYGGTSDPSNLVTACYQCNDIKSDRLIEDLGWALTPAGPAATGGGCVATGDEGGRACGVERPRDPNEGEPDA